MKYKYVAYSDRNEVRRGVLEAADSLAVERTLAADGFRLAVLKEQRKNVLERVPLQQRMPALLPLRTQEIINFTRSLSVLLAAGTSIIAALQLLSDQSGHPTMRKTVNQLREDVTSGRSFAQALAKHPKVFSNIYVRVVAAAEESGSLDKALEDLTGYMEREKAIKGKIGQTMIYPAFIVLVGVAVMAILFTVTLPQLITLFDAFGANLPLPTRILIGTVKFVTAFKLYLLVGILGVVASVVLLLRTHFGRWWFHWILLKLPVVRNVLLAADLSRFLISLGRLLRAGTLLPEAVQLSADTVSNLHIRAALGEVRQDLLKGKGLSAPLAAHPVFPKMLVHFVKIGEDSGTLDRSITQMAAYYDRDLEERSKTLVTLVEPTLTVLLGGGVAFVAISIIMPIYNLISQVGEASGI